MDFGQILITVVLCLFLAGSFRVNEARVISNEGDLGLERQLRLINKPPVKSIQTEFGHIVDCIDINKQLSFDHPLLKDHKIQTHGRESIAAKLVANLITEAGANRVLVCDLHSGQSMGYFDIPVDHVYGQPVILDYLASKYICYDDLVVVSPGVGGVARARAFSKKLSDAPLAIVDKRRHGHNVAEVMNLIGDVKGKVAVMVDDMIDTAGAALLHQEGAREVYACSTHAVFSPPAIERLSSGLFQEQTSLGRPYGGFMTTALAALNPIPAWVLTEQFSSVVHSL
ncbi:hypothetical protein CMV_014185 [Castanea mollissima]|uniref:Ribose-phosphate pyrophosphokinase n=1 Tax=Castanea mollissima TaxID=60419 RepID=A0A8J4RCH7_9ROSI|nr:hypothetical protein CMV_014185 [Castanea mollissima]